MKRRPLLAAFALITSATAGGCTGGPDESERTAEVAQEQQVCAAGATVEGIDVSVWQGNIDWPAVKTSGIAYSIARASYGTSKDTKFDQNWAGMKSVGLIRGAYQYWLPDKDTLAQAEAMVQIMGTLEATDLPPVVDVEETGGVDPATLSERLAEWLKHVETATGRKPIIYSGKYFWQDNVKSDAFLDYPLWIPNYSLECPDLPTGYWPDWKFFQYTSTGSISGISGNVDRNLFNGSLEDLQAFAASGGAKYAAKFVSQSFPYASEGPITMLTGESVTVSLEMENTGSEPWDESTRLATTEPRDRESPFAGPEWPGANRFAQVKGIVLPGETYKFTWEMHAPKTPGLFAEHMGLVQEGKSWFGDPGQGGPPDGQLQGIFQVDQGPVDDPFNPFATPKRPVDDPGAGGKNSSPATPTGCSAAAASTPPGTGTLLPAAALALSALLRRRRRS